MTPSGVAMSRETTDEYLCTTADGVWALGDIVGEYLLKHNANHEARTVVRNLFGDDLEPVDYTAMASPSSGRRRSRASGHANRTFEKRGGSTRPLRIATRTRLAARR